MAPVNAGLLLSLAGTFLLRAATAVESRKCDRIVPVTTLGVTFHCPTPFDSASDTYCCGPADERHCCSDPFQDESVVRWGITIGIVVTIVLSIVICFGYCCCSPGSFLNQRRHTRFAMV